MKNRDIVITGLQSWEIGIGSNCINIAIEFAKANRVLYVNPPSDRITKLKNGKKGPPEKNHLELVRPNLWVLRPEKTIESISRLPFNKFFDKLNKKNNRIFSSEIKKIAEQLGFTNFIHFCDSDMFRSFYLKEFLKPSVYIYYSRDNLLAVDYWKIQGKRIEPLHMKKADLVMANSVYLAEKALKHNPNSHFIGQGCDLSAYNPKTKHTVPNDIAEIPFPIIGYIGALTSLRLDIKILEYIALSKTEWNLVLIGPEDDAFKKSKLHNHKNVFFLGKKNQAELPAYLNTFNVAINPQKVNDVTIGNYPRKIDEYLAMGKPVVATKTVAMNYFSAHTALASSPKEWVDAIEKELNSYSEKSIDNRISFAAGHTWENNVQNIYNLVNNHRENTGTSLSTAEIQQK